MASYRARATGNFSNVNTWSVWNGSAWINAIDIPNDDDDVFSNTFTVTIDQNTTVLTIRSSISGVPGTGTVAGGGFQITTGGISFTVLNNIAFNFTNTYASQGVVIPLLTINTISGISTVQMSSIYITSAAIFHRVIRVAGTSVVNIIGDFNCGGAGGSANTGCDIVGAGVVNMIGNITIPSYTLNCTVWDLAAFSVFNLTGNIISPVGKNSAINGIRILGQNTINITGNLINIENLSAATGNVHHIISASFSSIITLTGNVSGAVNNTQAAINMGTANNSVIDITGLIVGGNGGSAGNGGAAILMSSGGYVVVDGSYVSGNYGAVPFLLLRLLQKSNTSKYIEFASNSTAGALFPIAPPTRFSMFSPNTIVDSPAQSNVREGVTYAFATYTGTLAVPATGSVALGVPTDDTVGTAVLTPEAIWDYATASITDVNSIGARLKNVSTVETTGSQLAAFLNG